MMPNRQQATDRNVMEIKDCNEGIRFICGNAGVGAGMGISSLSQLGFVVVLRGPCFLALLSDLVGGAGFLARKLTGCE